MSDLGRKLIELGAREEREAIVKAYNAYRRDNLPADAFELAIESREEAEQEMIKKRAGRIKRIDPAFYEPGGELIGVVNELVDAVNELREAKE